MKTEQIRLSIPVSKQVHEVFSRIAAGSGVSLGRCMGSWLDDTLDAADYMAAKLEEVKRSPGRLSRELTSYAAGLSLACDDVIDRAKAGKSRITPPSSNTGGKLPKSVKAGRTKEAVYPLPPAKVQAWADRNGVPPSAAK